jgi:hypothetical protein
MKERIMADIERHKKFQSGLLGIQEKKVKVADVDLRNYAKYILRDGSMLEKRELLLCLRSKINMADKKSSARIMCFWQKSHAKRYFEI